MVSSDQDRVIAFLSTPEAYSGRLAALPADVSAVERVDTHISIVWLVGERVYKLKRAVHFDYVDFSSSERRRIACEAEVRLNRRTAPSLYLGVVPVTLEAGGRLALAGRGEPVDWLVEMVRFDQTTLFDRLAERGRLDPGLMEGLADAIARLHDDAERYPTRGGSSGMAWVVEGNVSGLAEQGAGILDAGDVARLTAATRAALAAHAQQLDDRQKRGLVRACHGDLHLRNICLLKGRPTLFDAIEFNDDISCIDVFYDIAFLLMDLWHRDLRAHANVVLNEYLARTKDWDGLGLLPLFLSCRAAVRAKTSATASQMQHDRTDVPVLREASRQYLGLAAQLLQPAPPVLVAIGGLSGSGKSTLARHLAPSIGAAPGAVVVRSDVIRKELLGVPSTTRLGPEGYTSEMNRRVYEVMTTRALAVLTAGHAVVADAVYARSVDRDAIAGVARAAGVPFVGLWIDGPSELLARRLRDRAGDASDATPEVLAQQVRTDCGVLDWNRLDGTQAIEQVVRSAEATMLAAAPPDVRLR
jgi:aminoglycoside phosphotransferase family enzyme/predicted kinase